MVAALTASSTTADQPPATAAKPQSQPSFFHKLLSELNPLQYVPVVGTIYRAMTGDVIPETARFAGSLVVSGLTGGPVGVAINLGTSALERVTGVDPEAIGSRLLADIGIGNPAAPAQSYAKSGTKAVRPAPAPPALEAGSQKSWSVAQLSAYGVTQGADGSLARGAISGADVLNSLELNRLGHGENGNGFAAVA